MGRMRRERCDENAETKPEEAVKRPNGFSEILAAESAGKKLELEGLATDTSEKKQDFEVLPEESTGEQQNRKGKKGGRKRSRGKKNREIQDGNTESTPLHPINVNATGRISTKGTQDLWQNPKKLPGSKDLEHNLGMEVNESANSVILDPSSGNAERNTACMEMSEHAQENSFKRKIEEFSSPASESSKDDAVDRTVIWSNAAFCSDQQLENTLPTHNNFEELSTKGASVEEKAEKSFNSAKGKQESLDEQAGKIEKLLSAPILEEEETENLEEEIEKEIEVLTKRLAELRAKREAKHMIRERAKRALSCPPTPITPIDGDKSRCRKGRMISAKFLQWQTKPQEDMCEPKTAEKVTETTTEPKETGVKSCHKLETTPKILRSKVIDKLQLQADPGLKCVAHEHRGSLDGSLIEQMRNLNLNTDSGRKFDWTKSLRSTAAEKVVETHKKQAPENVSFKGTEIGSSKRNLSIKGTPSETVSLKGTSEDQQLLVYASRKMKNLIKGTENIPSRGIANGSSVKGDNVSAKGTGSDNVSVKGIGPVPVNPTTIDNISIRGHLSPSLTRKLGKISKGTASENKRIDVTVKEIVAVNMPVKLENIPAKGTTAEEQLLADLKESKASTISPAVTKKVRNVPSRYNVESPVQVSSRKRSLDGGGYQVVSLVHRKRASLENQAEEYSPPVSHVRKSGASFSMVGGQSFTSRLKQGSVHKTPSGSGRKDTDRKDGLETLRKKLPGLIINRNVECSPRDSGCVKRATEQQQKRHFFSTE